MRDQVILGMIALSLVAVGLVPAAGASHGTCQAPAENVEVCQTDNDPEPEHVTVSGQGPGDTSFEIEYIERTDPWGGVARYVDADAGTSQTDADVTVLCHRNSFESDPCADIFADADVTSEDTPEGTEFHALLTCWEVVQEIGHPQCDVLSLDASASYGDESAEVFLFCAKGMWAQEPCPNAAHGSIGVESSHGDQVVRFGGGPSDSSQSVCVQGDLADAGCQSAP